jgi:hypothetical protein
MEGLPNAPLTRDECEFLERLKSQLAWLVMVFGDPSSALRRCSDPMLRALSLNRNQEPMVSNLAEQAGAAAGMIRR